MNLVYVLLGAMLSSSIFLAALWHPGWLVFTLLVTLTIFTFAIDKRYD